MCNVMKLNLDAPHANLHDTARLIRGRFTEQKEEANRRSILIMDASAEESDRIKGYLNSGTDHYNVLDASNKESAYKILKQQPIHLVAVHLAMLQRIGIDWFVRQIGFSLAHTKTALLIITDRNNEPGLHEDLGICSIVDLISKPFSRAELKARVRFLLSLVDFVIRMGQRVNRENEDVPPPDPFLTLELSIYSESVRKKLGDQISRLYPYLNQEGRSKLTGILRRFQVDPRGNELARSVMAFDALNAPLYSRLEDSCTALTMNERRICAFVLNERTPAEIATISGKSLNSVNVAIARLRAKLKQRDNKMLHTFLCHISTAWPRREMDYPRLHFNQS